MDIYNLAENYSGNYIENANEDILNKLGLEKNQTDYKIISIDDARENGYNLQPDLYLDVNSETAVKNINTKKKFII